MAAEIRFDAALKPVEASSGASQAKDSLRWELGTVAPGEGVQLAVEFACDVPAETACLSALVSGSNFPDESAEACLQVKPTAGIVGIQVSDTVDPLAVGDETVYVVTVRNRGLQPLTELVVRLLVPEHLQVVTVESELGEQTNAVRFRNENGVVTFAPVTNLAGDAAWIIRLHALAVKPGDGTFRTQYTHSRETDWVEIQETTTVNAPPQ